MPVTAKELFAAGKLREAEKRLTAHLREHPADTAQCVFLFELLCFAGEYARAEKQLGVLAGKNAQAKTGAIVVIPLPAEGHLTKRVESRCDAVALGCSLVSVGGAVRWVFQYSRSRCAASLIC